MAGRVARMLRWTLHTRPCVAFVRHVLPRLHLPTRGISRERCEEGRKHLRLADVILSKSPLGIPAMLTRGWDHAALCVGPKVGSDEMIAEMTGKGFAVISWPDFCRHSRRVLILRCEDFRRYDTDEEYPTQVAIEALTHRRTGYDYQFEQGDDELTCAELPESSDFEGRMAIKIGTQPGTGLRYVSPQMILDADNVVVVWDSHGKLHGKTKTE